MDFFFVCLCVAFGSAQSFVDASLPTNPVCTDFLLDKGGCYSALLSADICAI